jgi:hypothetical protein
MEITPFFDGLNFHHFTGVISFAISYFFHRHSRWFFVSPLSGTQLTKVLKKRLTQKGWPLFKLKEV